MKQKLLLFTFLLFLMLSASVSFAQVSVTATAGTTGPTPYTTLKGAFDAINAGTHQGAITINVSANTTETASCVLNSSGAGSALYTSVLLKPTATATISGATGSGRGVIELNGADNVTIDGSIAINGTTRDLTITNTAVNTTTYSMGIRIAVATTIVTSANNVTIKNVIVNGSATGRNISTATSTTGSEATTAGIYAGGGASTVSQTTAPSAISSVSTTVGTGATMNNLIIENNEVLACARGITVQASAIAVINVLTISKNVIGSATANNATTVYRDGISAQGFTSAIISGNNVRNIEWFVGTAMNGIAIGNISTSGTAATIENNIINGVNNKNTGTFGAYGMNIAAGTGQIVRNNFITNVTGDMTGGGAFSTTFGVFGLRVAAGLNHQIYHNSVNLYGARSGTANSSLLTAAFAMTGTGLTGCDVRNNIFSNTITGGTTSIANVSMFLPTGGSSAMNLTLNNNAYYCNSTAGNAGICHAGTSFNTAALFTAANFIAASTTPSTNLRSYTSTLSLSGLNDNSSYASSNAAPFVSASDLHLFSGSGEIVNVQDKGSATSVTTDIDGDSRTTSTPDIGGDEVPPPPCVGMPSPGNTLASSLSGCSGGVINLSLQNGTSGAGVTYQWYDGMGPIMGANASTYNVTITANNSYYCAVTCSNSMLTGNSNAVSLSISPNPEGGDASGPSTALTGTLYNYTTTGAVGNLQWQFATALAGPYSSVPGPTSTTSNASVSFGSAGTFFLRCKASGAGCSDDFSDTITTVVTIVNDDVCNATNLNVGANGQYTNIGATVQAGEPTPPLVSCVSQNSWCSGGGNASNSVWFKFTPTVKGQYDFALSPTLFDSQFALWSVGDCNDFGSFELLAANDDITGSSPFNSKILPLCLDAGVTYYLQVDGFSTTTGSNWGIAITSIPAITYYADQDGDTFGDPNNSVIECTAPVSGYVTNDDDCNDQDETINPNGVEVCDYVDNNCNGSIDEGVQFTFYADADNDQFGNPNVDTLDCTAPLGYVSNDQDCNDQVMTINPYAAEVCDEVDNDCDELIDEGCGCTDPTAHNYDSEATLDDGSCETCSDGIKNGSEVNIDCGGNNPNCPTCPPPTAVCGNIVTVYTGGGAPVYNGPGSSDVWNIPAAAFDAGSVIYGTLSNRQVKRKYTNVAFNWTTDGSCIDATPNGVYNNNDKGLVYRNCLPVAPADFGKIRNFDMTISDEFGTSTCEGRYIVINSAPPGGNAPVYTIEQEAALMQALDDESEFSVFPNPGIDQIFIKTNYEEGVDKSVIITDITGRQVLKIKKLTSSLINVDTQTLGLGMYTITLNSANGSQAIKWLKVE